MESKDETENDTSFENDTDEEEKKYDMDTMKTVLENGVEVSLNQLQNNFKLIEDIILQTYVEKHIKEDDYSKLIQELRDYEDKYKKKEKKCIAVLSNGDLCTRNKKKNSIFCGNCFDRKVRKDNERKQRKTHYPKQRIKVKLKQSTKKRVMSLKNIRDEQYNRVLIEKRKNNVVIVELDDDIDKWNTDYVQKSSDFKIKTEKHFGDITSTELIPKLISMLKENINYDKQRFENISKCVGPEDTACVLYCIYIFFRDYQKENDFVEYPVIMKWVEGVNTYFKCVNL